MPHSNLGKAALTGAMIGGAGAAASNLHKLQSDEIARQEALTATLKTAAKVGVAAAAGKLAADMVGDRSPGLSLLAMFAAGAAAMYFMEQPTADDAS